MCISHQTNTLISDCWMSSNVLLQTEIKYVTLCAIWYHLHNLKNVKNIHDGVLLLVKLLLSAVFFFFFHIAFTIDFYWWTLLLSNNPSLILPEIIRYQFYYDLRRVLKGNIVHKRNSFLRDIHFVLYSACSKDDPWFVDLFFPKTSFWYS